MEQVLANGVVPSNLTNDVIAYNFPRAVSALIGKVDILFIVTICIRYYSESVKKYSLVRVLLTGYTAKSNLTSFFYYQ